jgi:hypothetical protein
VTRVRARGLSPQAFRRVGDRCRSRSPHRRRLRSQRGDGHLEVVVPIGKPRCRRDSAAWSRRHGLT